MIVKDKVALKYLNSFSVDVYANSVMRIYTEEDLLFFWKRLTQENVLVLFLGSGSNVLFLEDYNGVVFLNCIKGISLSEDRNYWYLHVCSGELWHEVVIYSLKRNIPGLENLAFIPGSVGAAPIQNIGAYGAELQMFCNYVDVLNLDIMKKIRFTSDECQFDYRNSVFLGRISFNYAVVAVGLRLSKAWKPILNYDGLNQFNVHSVTPREIFNEVCVMRRKKLPNPQIFGNAGSFFKNPIVNRDLVDNLLNYYPDIPFYIYRYNFVKLSAKWLIDQCCLQKVKFGSAEIYKDQSLILINSDQKATSLELIKLAFHIRCAVIERFNIFLEPEVRLIGNFGEIDGIKLFSFSDRSLLSYFNNSSC